MTASRAGHAGVVLRALFTIAIGVYLVSPCAAAAKPGTWKLTNGITGAKGNAADFRVQYFKNGQWEEFNIRLAQGKAISVAGTKVIASVAFIGGDKLMHCGSIKETNIAGKTVSKRWEYPSSAPPGKKPVYGSDGLLLCQ